MRERTGDALELSIGDRVLEAALGDISLSPASPSNRRRCLLERSASGIVWERRNLWVGAEPCREDLKGRSRDNEETTSSCHSVDGLETRLSAKMKRNDEKGPYCVVCRSTEPELVA